METQIAQLEKITAQIESEKDFSKVTELFSKAAELVKSAMQSVKQNQGKILEIIKDMDAFIEKEIKLECKC
jgi:exonuclease VII small subunit